MKVYGKLIVGILFLLVQVAVIVINGFPKMNEGTYSFGYLVGFLAPGVIGIIMLVLFFISKFNV